MKVTQKDSEKIIWDQMRSPSGNPISGPGSQTRILPKLMVWLILFVSLTYVVYTLKLVATSRDCNHEPFSTHHHLSIISNHSQPLIQNHTALTIHRGGNQETHQPTEIHHIVFGIAASAKLWEQRKNYIKIWFKPEKMRGIVWLDDAVKTRERDGLPPVKISGDTSRFAYTNRQGHRSAIRISRIVSETLRLVLLYRELIGVPFANIYFSYGMAYGGGGFAISYPLAKALDKMQDKCIQRYPGLYGSDDRMQACMAELGVPLTKETGFHQYDVYGNLFGLLAAHPVTPLVSLHHLDVVEPIFPNVTRVQALQQLMVPMKLDSAGLMQQSICYDKSKSWTISVSWGFAVQIFRGVFSPREIEMPSRTFLNWYRRADYTAYAFNTRPVTRNPCQNPLYFTCQRQDLILH
ncbi:hypothetical protein GH714_004114 [Hevea brasiliensis]|uniref:Uncharacterized protein n=1 Tax=Hevea brasiliensis TaxID=3981 RepID=A0A6A6LA32_HEVBR|nr:hypothetical protein GH714_004114 [Hevea brasiliensis]